jgi:outer membrane beta-barrel protein
MKRLWLTLLAMIGLALVFAPATVSARKVDLGDAPVIRKPLEWRKGRFGVSPVIGVTIGDPYWTSLTVGASGDYHILDWLAVGVDFRYFVGFKSGLLDQIESELDAARPEGAASDVTTSHLNWLVTANVQLIPLYGKFLLFDTWEVAYDFHVLAGVGYAGTIALPDDETRQIPATDGSVAPVFGGGFRFFVNSWLGFNLEFRDYLVQMVRVVPEYPPGVSAPGRTFENNFEISLGVTFLFPTEVRQAER